MNIIKPEDLDYHNYTLTILTALKQVWNSSSSFSCIGNPKEKNHLLYLHQCSASYTLKNGKTFFAPSGSIVYSPINAEYKVKFSDFSDKSCTYGINILLHDNDRNPFVLSEDNVVFEFDNINYRLYFSSIVNSFTTAVSNTSKQKSDMYAIISGLIEGIKQTSNKSENKILNSLKYLEDIENDMSISEIAKLMYTSETYFRRIFKKQMGISPVEYKIKHKIEKAKLYLRYDDINVSQIAEILGFIDTAYFTKMFKRITGKTPTAYKLSVQNKNHFS